MLRGCLVVLAVVASQGVARADLTTGVVVAGEPTMQQKTTDEVKAWLDHHGYTYVATLDGDSRTTFLNCMLLEDMGCARGSFEKRAKLASLVFVRAELTGGSAHEVSLTAYWFVRDKEVTAEKRWCHGCDDTALHKTVDEVMTLLARASGFGPLPAAPPATAPAHSLLVPGVLLGTGGATLVAAGVAFYYGHKGGPDAPLVYPDATRTGVVLSIVGASAVAAGAILWRRGSHAHGAPTASIGSTGTTFGWAGAF